MQLTIYLSLLFFALYILALLVRRIFFQRDRARMEKRGPLLGRVIAREGELSPGDVKKFWLICEKYRIDCFLVKDGESFHAYINRCRHMATPLDFVKNEFVMDDERRLICMMHGAVYEPQSGLCVEGPCKGLSLVRLPLLVDNGEIVVGCPQGDVSFLIDWAD